MPKKIGLLLILMVITFGLAVDHLSQRIVSLETELKVARDLLNRVFTIESKINTIQNILSQEKRIRIFRSSQALEEIDDTTISNVPKEMNFNWGGSITLRVGRDSFGHFYRALIKFNEIKKAFKDRKGQVLAATVYLKAEGNSEESPALKQILNLCEIKRNWGEGTSDGAVARLGESSWIEAAKSQVIELSTKEKEKVNNWETPGCWGPHDVDKNYIVATTGPTVNSAADGWVGFPLRSDGIAKLQQQVEDPLAANNGLLLYSANEETIKNNLMSFFSSESATVINRPYIEIIYVEQD